jgi:hypothetical protein
MHFNKGILWHIASISLLFYSFLHFFNIYQSAVNVPISDEWHLIAPYGIVLGWSKDFLLSFHNEHKIVLTKIIYLLNYKFFGLNFRLQIIFNALVFMYMVLIAWRLIGSKIGPKHSLFALIAFFPFASTALIAPHSMSFMGCICLSLFTFMVGTYLLFFHQGWLGFFTALFLLVLSMFSFAAGVGGAIAVVLFYSFWCLLVKIRHCGYKIFLSLSLIGLAAYGWFTHQRVTSTFDIGNPVYNFKPWSFDFLRFFAELISLGFGYEKINPWSSLISMSLVFFAALFSFIFSFRKKFPDIQNSFLLALTLGILAMLALVTLGRTGLTNQQAKTSHYAEIAAFLPILILGLSSVSKKLLKFSGLAVTALLIIGFKDNLSFSFYQTIRKNRLEARSCVIAKAKQPNMDSDEICPALGIPGENFIPIAKKAGMSFIKF